MRTVSKIATIVVFILLTTPLAHAQFQSGNNLVKYWEAYKRASAGNIDPGMINDAVYLGYVTGFADATLALYEMPSGVTVGQVCAVVGKYLDAHPKLWNLPACNLVKSALIEAFPKRKK
jgi:hypothetical protein